MDIIQYLNTKSIFKLGTYEFLFSSVVSTNCTLGFVQSDGFNSTLTRPLFPM